MRAAFKDGLVEAWREEQGAWRVALLDSSFVGDFLQAEQDEGIVLLEDLTEAGEARAINRVEGIVEVHSEDTQLQRAEATGDVVATQEASVGGVVEGLCEGFKFRQVLGESDSA